MVELIIAGSVGGIVLGWFLTRWYYVKATAEQKAKLHDLEDRMKKQGFILNE
jgi:hypothetical protein